jgi:hypothetical protein
MDVAGIIHVELEIILVISLNHRTKQVETILVRPKIFDVLRVRDLPVFLALHIGLKLLHLPLISLLHLRCHVVQRIGQGA